MVSVHNLVDGSASEARWNFFIHLYAIRMLIHMELFVSMVFNGKCTIIR